MIKPLLTIFIVFLAIYYSSAQSKFGIEFKAGSFKTENNGQLIGGGDGLFTSYIITKEEDPITFSYSVGLVYKLNERNLLKMHLGSHKNGRVLDYTFMDDAGSVDSYKGVNNPFHYLQVCPSYSYRILNKKWVIPVEIGININKLKNEVDNFVEINEYNFDFEINSGLQYRIAQNFLVGLHGTYVHYLTEYQGMSEDGTFKPIQFGIELSLLYEIIKEKTIKP